MNFLLTSRYKDSWFTLPSTKRMEVVDATVAFHKKYYDAKKLKDTYTFADGRLMSIWNLASFEEMIGIMSEHPYYGFVDFEADPFLDHQEVVKAISKFREASKKTAKK